MTKLENPVQMAVIGAAHGIKGELRVKTFTGDPVALGDYGPLYTRDGRAFEVQDIRPAGTVVVVRFKGVDDRSTAEALNGTALFVARAALPAEEENEFYHTDLVGLAVEDETGTRIGKVTAVQNFGGGELLEIMAGGRKGVLIPFSEAAVPVVDVRAGLLRINSLAAGLVEDDDDDGAPDRLGKFSPGRRPRGPKDAGGNR